MTKLKTMRQAKGLKLREVAERIKITPQTVHQMERIGIKKLSTAKRYAAVFGCRWEELID